MSRHVSTTHEDLGPHQVDIGAIDEDKKDGEPSETRKDASKNTVRM